MKTAVLSVDKKGWTDWLSKKDISRLVCCDCGLSHDIEIAIQTITTLKGDVTRKAVVRFRRNSISTGMHRKYNVKNFLKSIREIK